MGGEGSKTDVPGESNPRPHPETGPRAPSESPGKATRERGLLTHIGAGWGAEAGVTAPAQASSASQAEGSVGASK